MQKNWNGGESALSVSNSHVFLWQARLDTRVVYTVHIYRACDVMKAYRLFIYVILIDTRKSINLGQILSSARTLRMQVHAIRYRSKYRS